MNKIILTLSPTLLRQTMTVYNKNTKSPSSVTAFELKDLEKTVFSIQNIESITLVGNKKYTKKLEQKLKQYELTAYGKNNIEYRLKERE
jgi:hypothetical protein